MSRVEANIIELVKKKKRRRRVRRMGGLFFIFVCCALFSPIFLGGPMAALYPIRGHVLVLLGLHDLHARVKQLGGLGCMSHCLLLLV